MPGKSQWERWRDEEWGDGGRRRRVEVKPLVGDLRSATVLGPFVFHLQQQPAKPAAPAAGGFKRSVYFLTRRQTGSWACLPTLFLKR